jgi:hypothetical protein
VTLTTNGIVIQVTNTVDTSASNFRAAVAKKWQNLTVKTGGTLWGKTFIPFGHEGDIGNKVMMAVFQQQIYTCRRPNNALYRICLILMKS